MLGLSKSRKSEMLLPNLARQRSFGVDNVSFYFLKLPLPFIENSVAKKSVSWIMGNSKSYPIFIGGDRRGDGTISQLILEKF